MTRASSRRSTTAERDGETQTSRLASRATTLNPQPSTLKPQASEPVNEFALSEFVVAWRAAGGVAFFLTLSAAGLVVSGC